MFYISACHVVLLCLPFSCLDFCQMISGFATTTIGASKETEELGVSTDWCAARLLDDLWCLMCLINMYGGSLSACTMHEFVCYASVVCSTWKDASRNGSEGTWSDTGRFASLLPNIAWLHVHSISVLHWGMCASLQMGASMSFWPLAETFRRSLTYESVHCHDCFIFDTDESGCSSSGKSIQQHSSSKRLLRGQTVLVTSLSFSHSFSELYEG